jgi:hypothetical protein
MEKYIFEVETLNHNRKFTKLTYMFLQKTPITFPSQQKIHKTYLHVSSEDTYHIPLHNLLHHWLVCLFTIHIGSISSPTSCSRTCATGIFLSPIVVTVQTQCNLWQKKQGNSITGRLIRVVVGHWSTFGNFKINGTWSFYAIVLKFLQTNKYHSTSKAMQKNDKLESLSWCSSVTNLLC